ncbi:MAG TPA: EamA family transporter, partial [Roseateles sp.]|nr:EamA family transporter [Roseateles sp.]
KLASTLLAATVAASANNDPAALRGVLAAVASGVAYAVYASVIAGDKDDRGGSAGLQCLVTTGLSLSGAGAVLAPFAWRSTWPALDATSLARLLYLGLLATALAYALFASGLRVLRTHHALSLLAIQPVAAMAADLLLHHSSGATERPWAISLACASLLLLLLPWPLIPKRRCGGGTAPRDESPTQCP